MKETKKTKASEETIGCKNCGAELTYLPGSEFVSCNYCGHKEEIEQESSDGDKVFKELDLHSYLEKVGANSHSQEISMIQCKKCGANQHIEESFKSLHCVYCSVPLLVEDSTTEDWILPGAIIPFQIDKRETLKIFGNWVQKLWFAPNNLKKSVLDVQATKGLYLPFWTFDAHLDGVYEGQRGDHYYVSVSYTTMENGRSVSRTRQEQRTRWSSSNGVLNEFIDDTLIKASYQQKNRIPSEVGYWDLTKLEDFKNDYLSGFITEKYTIPLEEGHLKAKEEAERFAYTKARRYIGGDEQRVNHLEFKLSAETFKHILLPVYVSSYHYNSKLYHFYVNGQTGIISGQRPYSVWKIIGATLLFLLLCAVIYFLVKEYKGS